MMVSLLGIFVFSISTFGTAAVDPNLTGVIKIWGTLPANKISPILYDYSQNAKTYSVVYTEVSEDKIMPKFIQALATDEAPDLIFAPENILVPLKQFEYLLRNK